jgi:DNA replication ATP-dependent helicase Dna2
MEERDWIYDLPKGALENHFFDDFATQATVSGRDQPPGTQWKEVDEKETERFPVSLGGKENVRTGPKRAKVSDRALLARKPVLRDIMNDLFGA